MNESVPQHYLKTAVKSFQDLKRMGERTFVQLSLQDYFWKPNEDSNSIAILIQHLSGNMLSRWTDFLTTDGEKPDRNRDAEFENVTKTKEELMSIWEKGWNCLFAAIDQLGEEDLLKTVHIRARPHTVVEAMERALSHYAVHLGQIILLARMLRNADWQTLSIPKKKVL